MSPSSPVPPNYDWDGYGFDTRQVHAGEFAETAFGARVAPIYLTAAYRFDSFQQTWDRFAGVEEGHFYSRNLNPTQAVAEQRIASLEGGTGAILVGSGQAATTATILGLVDAGERFASTTSIYSGTRKLFDRTLGRLGVDVDYVWDHADEEEWERAILPETKAIFTESIPNPKNDVVDIPLLAAIARRHRLPLIVDNTIATPYLFRPLEHGADIVLHSATKFLTGHGAALSGVIVDGGTFDWAGSPRRYPGITEPAAPDRPALLETHPENPLEHHLRWSIVYDTGPAVSPFHAFLLQQGLETLSLRIARHLDNADRIARWLHAQTGVESVDYAGLEDNRYHGVARRLHGGRPGSVFSFTLRGGLSAARVLFDSLRVFSRMTNIGDVRSLALHPATTTHVSFSPEMRARLGIGDGLIRLSVGIETADDLIADLDSALEAVSRAGL